MSVANFSLTLAPPVFSNLWTHTVQNSK